MTNCWLIIDEIPSFLHSLKRELNMAVSLQLTALKFVWNLSSFKFKLTDNKRR